MINTLHEGVRVGEALDSGVGKEHDAADDDMDEWREGHVEEGGDAGFESASDAPVTEARA